MESAYDKIRFYKLRQKEKNKIVKTLKESLVNEKRVLLAMIFGSLTRRNSVRDLDICVYSAPTLNFKELLSLNAQIELDVGIPVDLVELRNLSPSFRVSVLKEGILIKGQKTLLHQLLDQANHEVCQ